MDRGITRMIDANLNRAREGLRVCEDITRFVMESGSISRSIKGIRHEIGQAARSNRFGAMKLGEARDSSGDVGRLLKTRSELTRRDLAEVFAANIERVKESLRVLEEVSKIDNGAMSKKFCALRFRVYEIEKRVIAKVAALHGVK